MTKTILYISLLFLTIKDQSPTNDFLANSSWPICHGDSLASDSSSNLGPRSKENLKH